MTTLFTTLGNLLVSEHLRALLLGQNLPDHIFSYLEEKTGFKKSKITKMIKAIPSISKMRDTLSQYEGLPGFITVNTPYTVGLKVLAAPLYARNGTQPYFIRLIFVLSQCIRFKMQNREIDYVVPDQPHGACVLSHVGRSKIAKYFWDNCPRPYAEMNGFSVFEWCSRTMDTTERLRMWIYVSRQIGVLLNGEIAFDGKKYPIITLDNHSGNLRSCELSALISLENVATTYMAGRNTFAGVCAVSTFFGHLVDASTCTFLGQFNLLLCCMKAMDSPQKLKDKTIVILNANDVQRLAGFFLDTQFIVPAMKKISVENVLYTIDVPKEYTLKIDFHMSLPPRNPKETTHDYTTRIAHVLIGEANDERCTVNIVRLKTINVLSLDLGVELRTSFAPWNYEVVMLSKGMKGFKLGEKTKDIVHKLGATFFAQINPGLVLPVVRMFEGYVLDITVPRKKKENTNLALTKLDLAEVENISKGKLDLVEAEIDMGVKFGLNTSDSSEDSFERKRKEDIGLPRKKRYDSSSSSDDNKITTKTTSIKDKKPSSSGAFEERKNKKEKKKSVASFKEPEKKEKREKETRKTKEKKEGKPRESTERGMQGGGAIAEMFGFAGISIEDGKVTGARSSSSSSD